MTIYKVSLHKIDSKAGVNLELSVAPWAVLNAFEIYFELGFATSQGCEGWGQFKAQCCAMDGYAFQESITTQTPPDGYTNLENIEDQTPLDGYTNL